MQSPQLILIIYNVRLIFDRNNENLTALFLANRQLWNFHFTVIDAHAWHRDTDFLII